MWSKRWIPSPEQSAINVASSVGLFSGGGTYVNLRDLQ